MLDFLKRLFDRDAAQRLQPTERGQTVNPLENVAGSSDRANSDGYFGTLRRLQDAIGNNRFEEVPSLVRTNLDYIPGWIQEWQRNFGNWEVQSIPAFEQGGRILALLNDSDGLERIRTVINGNSALHPWTNYPSQHQHDLTLFVKIQHTISSNPECLQTDIKDLVGEQDGRLVATLISYLERGKLITRIRHGRTYKLISSDSASAHLSPAKHAIRSHREGQRTPKPREIDLDKIEYIPLPRSPQAWEEKQASRQTAFFVQPTEYFEVRDADWQVESIEQIPQTERPDPAFRQLHPTESGMLMLDNLGNADGLGEIAAAALRYDRHGREAAKAGFWHNVYRVGVHPMGRGLIAMSRDCELFAYDEHLSPILETSLARDPAITAIKRRLGVDESRLHNHIRTVSLSRDFSRYVFTAVDEAWCISLNGGLIWCAKLPPTEGWERVAAPSAVPQTNEQVLDALELMGLSLPVKPDDIKQRYRSLARQWHPDVNRRDPQSEQKMTALNLAAETLTGIDVTSIPQYTGSMYSQEIYSSSAEIGGHIISISGDFLVPEINASDWIYASCFAAQSDSVYLAGYSGRVVRIDERGQANYAYDIGSVPRRIVDTSDYLYILTNTRLYILQGASLVNLVDTYEAGELIVTEIGFGLLQKNQFRWFIESGRYLGSVASKNPIPRVFSSGDKWVVETRQRRATITGAPPLWRNAGG